MREKPKRAEAEPAQPRLLLTKNGGYKLAVNSYDAA